MEILMLLVELNTVGKLENIEVFLRKKGNPTFA